VRGTVNKLVLIEQTIILHASPFDTSLEQSRAMPCDGAAI
jgi:hypothetical protein